MSGYCPECGASTCDCAVHGTGAAAHPAPTVAASTSPGGTLVGPLPTASKPRRLLGSGVEFFSYAIAAWLVYALDLVTGGIMGIFALIIAGLILLRDFKGGSFNIAKRVTQMRVVDRRSGRPASNTQALVRNSYYMVLLLFAAVLPWIDAVPLSMFKMFLFLDLMMIVANRQGLRLGDFLAGTQVVQAGS